MLRERNNRRGAGNVRKQMEVVTVQLSKLKADPKNARGHNRRNKALPQPKVLERKRSAERGDAVQVF